MTADDDYAEDLRDWYAEDDQGPTASDGIEPLRDSPARTTARTL